MKRVLVGGPLLGECTISEKKQRHLPSWNTTFAPLISDPVGQKAERLVLLPSRRFVAVLAYKTGRRIATLLPSLEISSKADDADADSNIEIASVALATRELDAQNMLQGSSSSSKQVLLAACLDGTIREYCLDDVVRHSTTPSTLHDCGPYWIPGACCHGPKRVFSVAEKGCAIRRIAATTAGGTYVYALIETTDSGALALLRVALPSGQIAEAEGVLALDKCHLCALDENVEKQTVKMERPFSLLVSSHSQSSSRTRGDSDPYQAIIVLPYMSSLLVYYDLIGDSNHGDESFSPLQFDMPQSNPLSAVAISSNGKDVVCGHSSGSIRVMMDLLPRIQQHCKQMALYQAQTKNAAPTTIKKPKHPAKGLIIRKLHWHAHPVASMAFGGSAQGVDPMLYSGGEESVIATWQLSRGISKPAEVLPRVALGGIVHMCCAHTSGEPDSMVVFCSDNSLHLYETHNQFCRWKVQGLAAGPGPAMFPTRPCMLVDPHQQPNTPGTFPGTPTPHISLTGLSRAPGHMQIYNPQSQRVTASLEVAPYNRISRTDHGDSPMPTPTITHCCWSETTLLTIDRVPTENSSVGACERLDNGTLVGSVTTIRFWSRAGSGFELVAAMASPHGSGNRVSTVALSSDGKFACSVSDDEGTFRLWHRATDKNSTEWICRYRVAIPSGYSNYATGAVTYSGDSSVLAIAFGNMVTLWDHHKVALLTSLWHLDPDESNITSLQFLNSKKCTDALMASSDRGVTLQSPYGRHGPTGLGWVWEIPSSENSKKISAIDFVPECDVVCVALFDETESKSEIILLDAATGGISSSQSMTSTENVVPDEVVAVTGVSWSPDASGWEKEDDDYSDEARQVFYLLTRTGELLSLINQDVQRSAEQNPESFDALDVPKLPSTLVSMSSRKRTVSLLTVADLQGGPKEKRLSLEHFGSFVGDDLTFSTLPQLRGAFARSFVARHLQSNS